MRGLVAYGAVAVAATGLAFMSTSGCAEGSVEFADGGASSVANTATNGAGGAGGTSLCSEDCASIATPQCLQSVCNDGSHQGVVGDCVVVPAEAGTACDDEVFCTVNDNCDGTGQCIGGGQNDCGMDPAPCTEVSCEEASKSCTAIPAMNGAPCQDPSNLCIKGSMCNNGICSGGMPDDCFFFPVPDDCHVAECQPDTGMCEAQIGNEGLPCVDSTDLCTVNKTCTNGMCVGGGPKDCSSFTQGCNVGTCDTTSGQCFGMPVMNGDPCDDLNNCTVGELCNNGNCSGGTAITQCIANDGCCPSGCNQSTDADCSCNVNLALTATAAVNPGGGSQPPYHPAIMNNGAGENCNEWAWMSNGQTTPGWATLTWNNVVTVGSMFIDSEHATMPACSTSGRDIASGEVQYMDVNNNWVSAGNISGAENYMFTFPTAVQAKAVRVWNVFSSAGNGNTMIHEWYVWPGFNCPTPTPN